MTLSTAGLVEALLALGVLVIVPLGVRLHPYLGSRWTPALFAAGVPAVMSLLLPQGWIAAGLAAPWVLLAVAAAGWCARCWLRERSGLLALAWVAAPAYLAVGAGWLVFDRAALEPAGVVPPFVVLTAVHFHYAGFVSVLLAALLWTRFGALAPRSTAAAVISVVGAPPIVAAGFVLVGVLQIAGAVVLTAGLFVLAWLTLRLVVPGTADVAAKTLLAISSLAVLIPMALAVQWAVGWNFGTPALSIPAMAWTHGVLNAVGFSLCGVLGWLRLAATHADGGATGVR